MLERGATHNARCVLPTCLTPVGSLVVSRAAKLLGYRFQGSLANFPLARKLGWLVLGLRPAGAPAGGVAQKRYVHGTKSECPSRAPVVTEVRPKRRYARL